MGRINVGITLLCCVIVWADLRKPGQFQFSLPSFRLDPKINPGAAIKQGMTEFEKMEFIPQCQGRHSPTKISGAQLKAFVGEWKEGLTIKQVNERLGEPNCAHPKTTEYETPQGLLVVSFHDRKAVGFELRELSTPKGEELSWPQH